MKGDFTRTTFQPGKHYSSVRMQQGRVQLDADWNEEMDILGHRLRVETIDVIGECGAPENDAGFAVLVTDNQLNQFLSASLTPDQAQTVLAYLTKNNLKPSQRPAGDFIIGPGRYYCDGALCENDDFVPYVQQPDAPGIGVISSAGIYLVYLDVWQRHIMGLDDPEIVETALDGPDTATRSKTVWQVKTMLVGDGSKTVSCGEDFPAWDALVAPSTGMLSAQAQPGGPSDDLCIIPEGGGYRRLENQLYRVEIHAAGNDGTATYKWSRDNGSVVTKLVSVVSSSQIQVSSIGRDTVQGFASGQWVEVSDDAHELQGTPGVLANISKVDGQVLTLTLPTSSEPLTNFSTTNGKVRRWDFTDAGGPPTVTAGSFVPLESGVQIRFEQGTYKTGDYWTIPARTLTGTVEWPVDAGSGQPLPQFAAGIKHAYCRLALVQAGTAPSTGAAGGAGGAGGTGGQPIKGTFNGLRVLRTQALAARLSVGARSTAAQARLGTTNGVPLVVIADCRDLFPPLTNLPQAGIAPAMHITAVALSIPSPSPIFNINPNVVGRVLSQLRPQDVAQLRQLPAEQQANFVRAAIQLPADQQRALAQRTLAAAPAQPAPQVAQQAAAQVNINDEALRLSRLASIGPVVSGIGGTGGIAGGVGSIGGVVGTPGGIGGVGGIGGIGGVVGGGGPGAGQGGGPAPSTDLKNDSQIALDALAQGIAITCDHPVAAASVSRPTCFISVEVPYIADLFIYREPQYLFQTTAFAIAAPAPAGMLAQADPFAAIVEGRYSIPGYHPYVLDASVSASSNVIKWALTPPQMNVLATYLRIVTAFQGATPILARLTLKGNAIWADDNPQLHLDGEAFGVLSGTQTALALPSGGGERGSDFEMWFWLNPPQISLTISPATIAAGQVATGTVSFTYPAPAGAFIALSSSNAQVATVEALLAVAQGATSANFSIQAVQAAAGTPAQQVTITAIYLGATTSGQLTVNPPQPVIFAQGVGG